MGAYTPLQMAYSTCRLKLSPSHLGAPSNRPSLSAETGRAAIGLAPSPACVIVLHLCNHTAGSKCSHADLSHVLHGHASTTTVQASNLLVLCVNRTQSTMSLCMAALCARALEQTMCINEHHRYCCTDCPFATHHLLSQKMNKHDFHRIHSFESMSNCLHHPSPH